MIKRIDLSKYNVKLRASIQASGRLSFTDATIKALSIGEATRIGIGRDEEDESLFMVFTVPTDENSFRIVKSGKNYYLPTKSMFDSFGFDYVNNTIIFDMIRMPELDAEIGGEVYKLNKREKMKES